MRHQPKYLVRGTNGTFIKYGSDVQAEQIIAGVNPSDGAYGLEPEETYGILETTTSTPLAQYQAEQNGIWTGRVPSVKRDYGNFWKDVVTAIRGGPLKVKPEQSRDGIRIMELARQSADQGRTLPFA